jgi:Glycosyl hydrolases family 43
MTAFLRAPPPSPAGGAPSQPIDVSSNSASPPLWSSRASRGWSEPNLRHRSQPGTTRQQPAPRTRRRTRSGSIDPHPFVDADGSMFLLWKADGNAIGQPSTLFAQHLARDGLGPTGQPVVLLNSGAAWEEPLIENPALIAAGRSYLLLYTGGWWESVGYATCDTPVGPCTKATVDHPLLASSGDQAGPGGATVVRRPAGDHWLAYHAWTPGAVGYNNAGSRSLHFASVTWSHGQPVVAR